MIISEEYFLVRTKQEAALLLGVSRQTIHKWDKSDTILFHEVDRDWLVRNLGGLPEFGSGLDRTASAYILSRIPPDVLSKRHFQQYRSVYLSLSEIPGSEVPPDTSYSIAEAAIILKEGRLLSGLGRRLQKGYSRSYMYGIMGDTAGKLRSFRDGGRRFITEKELRRYQKANGIPELKILLRIFEKEASDHWEEREVDPTSKKPYSSPRVLYFKPFG